MSKTADGARRRAVLTPRQWLAVVGGILLAAVVLILIGRAVIARIDRSANAETVAFLESVMPGESAGVLEERSNSVMPAAVYRGVDYAAVFDYPSQSVTLPVAARWDTRSVGHRPCVFSGDPYDGSLIIGGTDTAGQFDFLGRVDIGDALTVTDMAGAVFHYRVTEVIHADDAARETLEAGDSDFTFFARESKTGETLIVRCKIK